MAETTHTGQRRDQLSWTAEFFHFLPINSSALYYLQTPTRRYGHASTPPQFLPISGDRAVPLPPSLEWHVWSSSSGNNCHAVHRSLFSEASLCDGMVRFFTLSHIVSQAVFYNLTFSWSQCKFIFIVLSSLLASVRNLNIICLWWLKIRDHYYHHYVSNARDSLDSFSPSIPIGHSPS